MFLINSAFVGKIFLYLSKCTVKQQLKFYCTVCVQCIKTTTCFGLLLGHHQVVPTSLKNSVHEVKLFYCDDEISLHVQYS
jgi:hypothetical protein